MQVENNDSWWDWLIGSCFSIFKNMQFHQEKRLIITFISYLPCAIPFAFLPRRYSSR
ncbi:hypothetical protein J9874_01731 [Duffyella gerundensis]|nr:hypothetical protein J9874_01731 [Duffyella gerundensis]